MTTFKVLGKFADLTGSFGIFLKSTELGYPDDLNAVKLEPHVFQTKHKLHPDDTLRFLCFRGFKIPPNTRYRQMTLVHGDQCAKFPSANINKAIENICQEEGYNINYLDETNELKLTSYGAERFVMYISNSTEISEEEVNGSDFENIVVPIEFQIQENQAEPE